ncbi:response regulator [Treponema pedis]|uniref:Response regulator n=2 Tax=Treponema pedis TaxID=409322 RepID=S5ZSF6_9SPIR|nr:response regulator [Treponema pedis]AGT43020.1 response regulator [Treponema pedis str. T A4]QOW60599.1 response regulator [Treponema pedis]QSI03869.1 response regulator [Treponema pedis]
MKQVLLIDIAPTLRNYITKKLYGAKVLMLYAESAEGAEKAFEFMKRSSISLIIIDYNFSRDKLFNFFEKKQHDAEIAAIPSIVLASSLGKYDPSLLASYGVKKIISKPVRVDELLSALGFALGVSFQIDRTPCILETRVNEDVIFVELSQGLNRDKIELLQFRLMELIELYKLQVPKVLIIMTDINLTYADVSNLEYLIDGVLTVKSVQPKNIKFLTLNKLVSEFFEGNPAYKDVKAVASLAEALSSFSKESGETKITSAQELLQSKEAPSEGNLLETRFRIDTGENLSVAIVDDDLITRKMMAAIFYDINANVHLFENGDDFLKEFKDDKYDIVFLDMIMPGISGIDVLAKINLHGYKTPFIILSSVDQKTPIIKALERGAKRYVLKPVKKETILRKTEEVLGGYI